MFYEWRDALKLARKQKKLIDGQMVHHNRRMKQGCLREWKKFTLKSRAEKHCNKTVTSKVRSAGEWAGEWFYPMFSRVFVLSTCYFYKLFVYPLLLRRKRFFFLFLF